MACTNCRRNRVKFGNVATGFANIEYINQASVSFNGLLDDYPNAAAAYSIRLLRSAYSGALFRIRRSSDNAEKDFYPDSNNELSLSSDDGSGTTLSAWISSNDGYVVTWYDQSGNARNATNATASQQPKIITAGVINLSNSKPTFSLLAANQTFLQTSYSSSQPFTYFAVFKETANLNAGIISFFTSAANGYALYDNNGTTYQTYFGSSLGTFTANLDQNLFSAKIDNTSSLVRLNTSEQTGTSGSQGITNINIGSLTSGFYCSADFQEFVLYPSDKSSDITGIETNINDFYSIY